MWFTLFVLPIRGRSACVLLALTALYVGASLLHRGSLKIFRWTLPVPPFRLTIYQIAIASADMLVAGSVLYVLFPPIRGGYLTVLEVYLVAYVLIVLSHVPGGWGVLEAGMMTLLGTLKLVPDPDVNMPKVFAGIIVFRVIYFLLPLLFAAVMVGWHEYALRKKWIPPIAADPDDEVDEAARSAAANGHAGSSPADTHATNGRERAVCSTASGTCRRSRIRSPLQPRSRRQRVHGRPRGLATRTAGRAGTGRRKCGGGIAAVTCRITARAGMRTKSTIAAARATVESTKQDHIGMPVGPPRRQDPRAEQRTGGGGRRVRQVEVGQHVDPLLPRNGFEEQQQRGQVVAHTRPCPNRSARRSDSHSCSRPAKGPARARWPRH